MFQSLSVLLALAFPALVLIAALKDVTSYTIPNWIPLGLVAAFPAAALAAGLPLQTLALHAGLSAAVLVVGMGMFSLNWIGGGDAKLLAASALWLGWPATSTFLLVTVMAGGALAFFLLRLRTGRLRPLALLGPSWVARLAQPGEGVPYGLAIAAGALAAFQRSPFMALSPV